MIKNLCNVFIFVEDQEKAKNFWCDKVGFELKIDSPINENNSWIEVIPPSKETTLVLYPKNLRKDATVSNNIITFFTDDIQKTYSELSAKGVKFSKEPYDTGYGIFTEFYDEDGNSFSLKQV